MTNSSAHRDGFSSYGLAAITGVALGTVLSLVLAESANADTLPGGEWARYCTEAQMDGPNLKANCWRSDGARVFVAANVQACGGVVSYDVQQSRFYCGYREGMGYGTGLVEYVPVDPLPPGQWRERCKDAIISGDMLKAACERSDGSYRATEIRIGTCAGRTVNYSLRDGRFDCGGYIQASSNGHFPGGGWKESCSNASMRGWVLRAQCSTKGGQIQSTEIDTSFCPSGVYNDNGRLRCQ